MKVYEVRNCTECHIYHDTKKDISFVKGVRKEMSESTPSPTPTPPPPTGFDLRMKRGKVIF